MKRRTMLQLAGMMAAIQGCGGGSSSSPSPAPAPGPAPSPAQPNVLMIAVDDLNDWVGFLGGHPQVKTPFLDALAARSTVFEHAYCTVPVCSASRASALTGLSPQSTGVYDLSTTFRAQNPNKAMVGDMFASAGYATKLIGKIDHNFTLGSQPLPTPFPYANKQCSNSSTLGVGAFDWGPAPGTDADQSDYRFAQQAIDFLGVQPQDKPFFLAVGLVRTHVGWYVPQRFFDMYPKEGLVIPDPPPDDLDDIGPAGRAIALQYNFQDCIVRQGLWVDAVQAYLASISWVDSQIGRVLAALEASAHASNTLVVLWSDHGFHLGEKFHWHKLALWERATRVPFLISTPGQTSRRDVSACVSLQDMTPTLLDACQVARPYAMDGTALQPLLSNPEAAWAPHVVTTLNKNDYAVRTPDWRYIRYSSGERELYDEHADPEELHNLSGDPAYAAVMTGFDALLPAAST